MHPPDIAPVAAPVILRKIVREDFTSFIGRAFATVDPGARFLPNWHIEAIAEHLEAARNGEFTRLIINMPPRMLKSVSVSVAWPAWLLGHEPTSRVIAASYALPLAVKHSVDCRELMRTPWYHALFPATQLSSDQNEKHKFMTTARGYRLATSVGGTLTGEGGNFLIIDDPINPAQAESESERNAANRWFDHTFASRLDDKHRGVMVLVMQRLHPEDLTGHLLAKGGWQHLCLPAVAPHRVVLECAPFVHIRKEGELLHEAREDTALLERARNELGSRAFAAQYQQDPLPAEGGLVKAAWLRYHDTPPQTPARIVHSWDTAIKAGTQHDASVCLTFAESEGVSYLLDALVFRAEYPELKKRFLEHTRRHAPHLILLEDKASGQQLLQDLKGEHLPLVAVRPKADKYTRTAAISALIEAGRLSLPRHAHWLAAFEAELLHFPSHPHDDQVDALTQYLDHLRTAGAGQLRLRRM